MEVSTISNSVQYMPSHHVHSSKKGDNYVRNCMLAIKSMSTVTDDMGRSSRENKEVNYDLVNSIFRENDFDYVLNPYGFDMNKFGGTPTKMQNYNIIRSRLETLRGEEMNTPLSFFVYAIAGEAVSAKKQMRKDVLRDLMKAHIRAEFGIDKQAKELEGAITDLTSRMETVQDQQQLQELQQQLNQIQQQRQNMPDIQTEMTEFNSKYVDPTEQTNNKILHFLKRNDQLALKFNQGWFHALVSAEEIYYTGIRQGHPSARACNPLQIDYDKGANTTFIHEGNWVKEEYWLPIGECISEYGDALTDTQVKKISTGQAGHTYMANGMQQGFVYSYSGGQRRSYRAQGVASHVYIMKGAWRGFAKVGILRYKDQRSGKWEEVEVDDTFKMTPELEALGAQVEWKWDDEIWEGTMIGDDIFVNGRPRANQTHNLPYIGYIYNNVNSIATSLVDLVKAHQYTYIIVWWRLEQELAKAKGKKFIMDFAQLPKSMGWDVDKWMYYFDNMGVIWINSREEGRKGDPSSVAQFNQFNSIDMALSQVVPQYMEVLNKLEALVEDIMGVSPQRMGNIKPSETATGAQTAVSRSTNVTRPWFYFHDLCKEAVLTELLELAKIAYIDGAEMELVLTEKEVQSLIIDGDKLNGSQMGVFVTDSYEDRQNRDKMEALLTMAVQQGKASLTEVAKVLKSDSMNYALSALEEGERKKAESDQAAAKMQQDTAQQTIEHNAKESQLDRAKDVQIGREKNAKDILVKKMDIGTATGDDADLKAVETVSKISLEDEKHSLEVTKEENRKQEASRAASQKDEEIKIAKKVANKPNTPKS